jgi:predicted nucleic acid-binding protein
MTANVFIDTNLYIYALVVSPDKEDAAKSRAALSLFQILLESQTLITSVQVLNELHSNLIKKFKLNDATAFQTIEQNIIPITTVKPISYQTYQAAYQLRMKYNFSYWDSLIIASSLENNCSTLYSEDMQHRQIIEDSLTIINPFQP